ncbi:hypothetical protein L0Y41_01425 [bacterium]|nr:hypothetical protein [bacterium]
MGIESMNEADLLHKAAEAWDEGEALESPSLQSNAEGDVEDKESTEKEILVQEDLLRTNVSELEDLTNEARVLQGSPEETQNKWEQIQEAYETAKLKVLTAFAALTTASMGSAMAGHMMMVSGMPHNIELYEKGQHLLQMGGVGSWAAVGTLALGFGYNKLRQKWQEKKAAGG